MKPIHFRGQNFDLAALLKLQGQGHRQTVATADIITLIANPSVEARMAVQVEGKFHLLTGAIDPNAPANELYVLSKPVLKKALVAPTSYAERQQDARDFRDHQRFAGFNDFSRDKQPLSSSGGSGRRPGW